jgi:serine/threonine protein kinase
MSSTRFSERAFGLQSSSHFTHDLQMGYAHRDVKPDNFLIDAEGDLEVSQT